MVKKLKITSPSVRTVRHIGATLPTVGADAITKALGAADVVRADVHGSPIALYALRQEIEARLRSTGGRPALEGATRIQKIPLKPEDWRQLEGLAAQLSRQGVAATAGQVASIMVHKQLEVVRAVSPRSRGARAHRVARGRR